MAGGGLAAEIANQHTRKGPACRMGQVEAQLTPTDLTDLRAAFEDQAVLTTAIFRALKARGYPVHEDGVRKHRRGECACDARS